MKKAFPIRPNVFKADEEATDVLAANGNRLLLIEAIIVLIVVAMPYYLFSAGVSLMASLLEDQSGAGIFLLLFFEILLDLLFSLFVMLPLFCGLLRMARLMAKRKEVALPDLFFAFGSKRDYGRMLALSFDMLWRLGITVAVIAMTVSVVTYFFFGNVLAAALCSLAVIVEVFLGFFLCMRGFPLAEELMHDEISVRQARERSRDTVTQWKSSGTRFFFAFLPRILLGLLTFGIYLVWDALPRMCVAYFIYCEQIDKLMIRSEEYKDHE